MHFKPLVEVDPTIKLTTNRNPLQKPRPGDYSLQKIASTEAVAAKKSLELKKRYLLGETQSSGVLKSDSASALDLKLKSFQSNISECQKLLNPAPDISTAMKTFLSNTNKLTESSLKGPKNVEEVRGITNDEKENVNVVNVTEKNEINQVKSEGVRKVSSDEYIQVEARKVNIEIVDNEKDEDDEGLDQENNDSIEVIDLTTPQNSPMNGQKHITKDAPLNKNLNSIYIAQIIDLTGDSPAKDRSLVETKVNFSVDNNGKKVMPAEYSVVPDILSTHNLKNVQEGSDREQKAEQRDESPILETSIEVPVIPWRPKQVSDMDSDSLSESSTSSIDDIPHFALDSATSPEQCDRRIPKLEVRDETGEVMQIDSLMIINGEYIGYPDDENEIEEVVGKDPDSQAEPLLTPKSECREFVQEIQKSPTVIEVKPVVITNKAISKPEEAKPRLEYKGMKNFRPEYRFDTKNENKIDTLKNLPLIVGNSAREFIKVAVPQHEKFSSEVNVVEKPTVLTLPSPKESPTTPTEKSDDDKTPINQGLGLLEGHAISDTETEVTGQLLTETELSDWTADDAVSENFIESEFVMNSNKGKKEFWNVINGHFELTNISK